MSIKKLAYYLEDANVTLRSDHLPLKKFLAKNTLHSKVNNWAIEISPFQITFEYIKGIKNTLADTMSLLIDIDPQIQSDPEPEGYEFGYYTFDLLPTLEVTNVEVTQKKSLETWGGDVSDEYLWKLLISNDILSTLQQEDNFCKNIFSQIEKGNLIEGQLYLIRNNILKRYIIDGDDTYETIMIPRTLTPQILQMSHNELGHNRTHRTYILLKRLYYIGR